MDLNEKLYELSERITKLKDSITTEEATKQSFILPFFQALGYDVFNPLEFVPEFTADVGIKKGEKVDYAILQDGNPLIIIEAKTHSDNLEKRDSQLFRYFGTTKAKFAILTNGIVYKFYSDLDQPNVMDSRPFYILDMLDLNEQSMQYLEKFVRSNLDIDSILNTASDLKYISLIKSAFKNLMDSPTDDFVKLILSSGVYDGMKNQRTIEKFRPITKRAINQYVNEKMSSKFKETLNSAQSDILDEGNDDGDEDKENKIITTFEELNAFAIVKSILRKEFEPSRIVYRDTERYFGILLDDNNRKWICRINLDTKNKHIIISDENKKGIRYDIDTLDDLYNLEDELLTSAKKYQ